MNDNKHTIKDITSLVIYNENGNAVLSNIGESMKTTRGETKMRNKWTERLLCIKDYRMIGSVTLTKGKIYEIKNGALTYDDGWVGSCYKDFEEFIKCNSNYADILIIAPEKDISEWEITETNIATYISLGNEITIAIPPNTPMGITTKHPDDRYSEEIGQSVALKRLYELQETKEKIDKQVNQYTINWASFIKIVEREVPQCNVFNI